ncbi:MAG: NnrS family protein, partial [Rudaea sp.]
PSVENGWMATPELPSTAAPTPRRVAGNAIFFPAAAAYAIVVLPFSVLSMLGSLHAFAGLLSPAGHAHEMLFGFALAVVAGNQLGPRTPRTLALLFATWLLARLTFLFVPHTPLAAVANAAFPALLAWHLAPRLFTSAKKWRNQALPAVVTAICASAVAYPLTVGEALGPVVAWRLLLVAIALFALLLLFMGGRLIAPAVAGALYRQGEDLAARVQPRIEGALIVSMALAALALALEGVVRLPEAIAALALAAAGMLAAVRIARWRLWRLRGRPDLLCLAAGYAWLALGLVLLGAAHAGLAPGASSSTVALHVITIGSLGTLTLNVMAMTRLLKARRGPASTALSVVATLLLAAATVLRVLAGYAVADPRALLLAASLGWSAAFGLLLALLLRPLPPRAGRHARESMPQPRSSA